MDSKKLLLAGILVIAASGVFVYFDPMDLDLLGLKQKPVVAKPEATQHAPTPVAKAAVIAPKSAAAPTQVPAAVPTPAPSTAPAAATPSDAPKAAVALIKPKTPAGAAITSQSPTASPPVPPVAEAVQAPQPPMKLSKETKTVNKPERAKNKDLRYCLDLETDEAIAKCAGE